MYAELTENRTNFYQWDSGQYLVVSADVVRIDFCFRQNAEMVYGVFAKNGRVIVPDVLLQRSGVLDALVMGRDDSGTATYLRMEIAVFERPIPPGYIVTDNGAVITYEALENILGQMNFLQTTGGTMSGDIHMDGRAITGLVDPAGDTEPVRLGFADFKYLAKAGDTVTGRIRGFQDPVHEDEPVNKRYHAAAEAAVRADANSAFGQIRKVFTVTVPAEWVGDAAPFSIRLDVEGILEEDTPHYCAIFSGTAEEQLAQKEAFSYIDEMATETGAVTFRCLEEKPVVALTMQLEVIRGDVQLPEALDAAVL